MAEPDFNAIFDRVKRGVQSTQEALALEAEFWRLNSALFELQGACDEALSGLEPDDVGWGTLGPIREVLGITDDDDDV